MKIKTMLILIIAGLVILNVSLLFHLKHKNESLNKANDEINLYKTLKDKLKIEYQYNGSVIQDSVYDKNLNKIRLSKSNIDGICIYVNGQKCNSCIKNQIQKLLAKEYFKEENCLIFSDFSNIRKFKAFVEESNMKEERIYNFVKPFNLKKSINSNYFIFTLDNDLIIRNLFIPKNFFPELTNKYIQNRIAQ
jgi:hypothetical protein